MLREGKEYTSYSSLHGLSYFFDTKFHILQRFFWIVITSTMFCVSCFWVERLIRDWDENPTKLVTASSLLQANDSQFPTITICNDFDPDRWGFLRYTIPELIYIWYDILFFHRNLLNNLEYQCLSKDPNDKCDIYDEQDLRSYALRLTFSPYLDSVDLNTGRQATLIQRLQTIANQTKQDSILFSNGETNQDFDIMNLSSNINNAFVVCSRVNKKVFFFQ